MLTTALLSTLVIASLALTFLIVRVKTIDIKLYLKLQFFKIHIESFCLHNDFSQMPVVQPIYGGYAVNTLDKK